MSPMRIDKAAVGKQGVGRIADSPILLFGKHTPDRGAGVMDGTPTGRDLFDGHFRDPLAHP